jgi:gliding motility-associated-like protein
MTARAFLPLLIFFFLLAHNLLAQPCPPRPSAALRLTNNDLCGEDPVSVSNVSEENGNSVFYVWDWGDGSRDTVQDRTTPTHRYRERGDLCNQSNQGQSYSLNLYMINRRGGCFGHQAQTTVFAYARPRADFDAPAEVCIDNPTAQFTNKTCPRTTPNTTYAWNFGDPTSNSNTSTDESPQHRFTGLGEFEVTLTVNSFCGSTVFRKKIKVVEPPVLAVNYTPPTATCTPLSIVFQNNSVRQSGNRWTVVNTSGQTITEGVNFGNGSSANSQNATIEFTKKGIYRVILTISSPCGDKTWQSQDIAVETPPKIAIDSFSTSCVPFSVVPMGKLLDDGGSTPQYRWTFQGGTPATATSLNAPQITFNTAGTYTMILQAENRCGVNEARFTTTFADKIRPIFPNLTTTFCNTDTATIRLAAQPAGGTWSGAAVTAEGVFRPSVVGIGNYPIRYLVQQGSCRGDSTVNLTVGGAIVETGTAQSICGTNSDLILRGGNPMGGTWRGLGISDSTAGIFKSSITGLGSFTVTYVVRHATTGCINSATKTISVLPTPIARFDSLPTTFCQNTTQIFRHRSVNAARVQWSFGDNTNSNLDAPSHIFTQTGLKTIKLLVTNTAGCTDSVSQPVMVNAAPQVRFRPSATEGCSPLDITFENTSTNDPNVRFNWNFGNGTTAQGRTPDVTTFVNNDLQDIFYKIKLTAQIEGCGAVNDSAQIMVSTRPKARFGVDADTGCSPMTVRLTQISTGSPRSYRWDLGNNTSSTLALPPFPTFTTDSVFKTFNIKLVATNACGVDSTTLPVVVRPSTTLPFFSLNRTQGCAPLTVRLTNFAAIGATVTYDFGDGNRYTNPNPTYTYNQAGTFTITQFASGGCGFDSTKRTVTVFASPSVSFSYAQARACKERKIQFRSQFSTNANLTWDFGDSTTNGQSSPIHDYLKSGTYRVILTAASPNGCSAADTQLVTVSSPLIFKIDSVKHATCFGVADGAIVVGQGGVTGGAQVYEFSLNDSTFQKINKSGVFSNLIGRQFYTVWVRDTGGCMDSNRVFINGLPPLSIDVGDERNIDLGDSVQIFVTSNRAERVKAKWTPLRGLRCDSCTANWARPFATTTYTIVGTDAAGCSERAFVTVNVNRVVRIFVPNAFTPNDDGVNDFIQPFAGVNVKRINYWRVFDRWGSLLHETRNADPTDPTLSWDGRFKGKRLSNAVFVYVMEIELLNGEVEILRGEFSLIL